MAVTCDFCGAVAPGDDIPLTWTTAVPEPPEPHVAECGVYVFEISAAGNGHLLQMWQSRSEDWPLLVWEMDGYSLDEAKAQAERLADQHVPAITQ